MLVNEIIPQFAETYRINRDLDKSSVFIGDICELNAEFSTGHDKFNNVTLVCGGPPCQGFSMANRQRIIDDPRNMLYKEYLKFLCTVCPAFFIMENVRGMQSRWDEIESDFNTYLNKEGHIYNFTGKLLLAEDYGVPQHRERFIVIGNRLGIEPEEIFKRIFAFKCQAFVLKDALYGLPALGVKREKGRNDIEDDNTGYTQVKFNYPDTEFYHYI